MALVTTGDPGVSAPVEAVAASSQVSVHASFVIYSLLLTYTSAQDTEMHVNSGERRATLLAQLCVAINSQPVGRVLDQPGVCTKL